MSTPQKLSPLQQFVPFQQRIERFLSALLADVSAEPRLGDAMRYAVLGGGKRIRPLLVYGSALACSRMAYTDVFVDASIADHHFAKLDAVAAAVELVHCYSLVHDDLPPMDNDALRRGQATCHLAFDEATAILAGDALLTLAFECLSLESLSLESLSLESLSLKSWPQADIPAKTQIEMIQILAKASGPMGMVGGQAADMAAIATLPTLDALASIHQLKTGALIQVAVQLGAMAVQAEDTQVRAVLGFAKAIGLAFQIQDDVLDVVADTEKLGKMQGADALQDKPTYVSLLGLKGAEAKAARLLDEAFSHLATLPGDTQILSAMAEFMVKRGY